MPAVLSTSCAFMLPMATGPNAVVFASGRIEINDMLRQGLILNFLCALALTLIII
ncbi:anion permease [Sedimenticola sp.]|uniref:anion permease n=1 Tax=Sedimenticola sp. TaxID=1940285 RepID=UPI003D0E8EEF